MLREIIEVATKKGMKVDVLGNGVVIVVKDGYAYVQVAVVRDVYYVRYLTGGGAYIVDRLDARTAEKILDGKLDETEAVKLPDT